MNSLARARSMRFEWQKLVTPLTSKADVAAWRAKDSEIAFKNREASGTPLTVEAIDWDAWKAEITTPGLVEEMQKEYEALNFTTVDPFNEETAAKIETIEAEVVQSKKAAVHGANEVKETAKVVAQVNKIKTQGVNWDLEDWYSFIPGLKDQHMAEYEDEEYLVSDDHLRLEQVDWKAAGKEFAAGVNPDLGPADARVGDLVMTEEKALQEAGTWSVARLFASKDERAKIQEKVEKSLASI